MPVNTILAFVIMTAVNFDHALVFRSQNLLCLQKTS